MRRGGAALVLAFALLAACGGDEPAPPAAAPGAPSSSTTVVPTTSTDAASSSSAAAPTTIVPTLPVIIERRAPSDEERLRLGSDRPLTCPGAGWSGWDYDDSPIQDDPGGLTSEQALMEMLIELNAEGSLADEDPGALPMADWLELVDGDTTTFAHPSDDWRILITFATYEPAGVFRPLEAKVCPPEGFVPPTDPPTTPPPTMPPYVATTVDLPPGVTFAPPGGYQTAGPVVSALECNTTYRPCVRMAALLEGVLRLDHDCLFVEVDDPLTRVTVVWPEHTVWDFEQGMLIADDGRLVGIGEPISTGGGFVDTAGLELAIGTPLPPLVTDCAARLGSVYWFAGAA